MINVGSEAQIFTRIVFASTEKLIKNGVFAIDKIKYKSWRKNFKTSEENYLCACILDSLIYRSNKQIVACFESLFNQVLPSLIKQKKNGIIQGFDILTLLRKNQALVKLVTVNSAEKKGKSSDVLVNILRKKLRIVDTNIISPEEISGLYEEGTSLFIFIDDFLCSGRQFTSTLSLFVEPSWDKGLVVYCPLIGHEKGIDKVAKQFTNVIIQPIELIPKNYCFFNKYFSDDGNTPEIAKVFYEKFLLEKGFEEKLYGFEDYATSVAFDYSCPDNNLLAINGKTQLYSNLFD